MSKSLQKKTRIIVACADRKAASVPADLRLRNYRGSLSRRADRWIQRIDDPRGKTFKARDLYRGEHWSNVLLFEGACTNTDVWVASAGYGLTHLDERLEPYGATFTPRHVDSVALTTENARFQEWWAELSRRHRRRSLPPTIESMAKKNPSDAILVAVSPYYLKAMTSDLVAAARHLDDPDLMTILTTKPVPEELRAHAVRFDDRVMSVVGGTLNAIYPRTLRLLAKTNSSSIGSTQRMRESVDHILMNARRPIRVRHDALTDEGVIQVLIRSWSNLDKPPTKTAALKHLRESGKACEQNRFALLYQRAREEIGK